MTEKLTHRQREILDFIRKTMRKSGYPPTRAEIAECFGFRSPNAAEDHLRALARKGVIELQSGISRGIQVLTPWLAGVDTEVGQATGLPLIGRVAAGSPILAIENVEDHFALDPSLFRPRPDYLLRVEGMSMRDAGILDGDLLVVHHTPQASNRQIVVVRLDDEVTVKRFIKTGKRVQLLPENPDFQPIEVDLSQHELVIEGLGIGVIRNSQPLG